MPPQKLIDYIQSEFSEGVKKKVIKEKLLQAGWQEEQIQEGFQVVEKDKKESEADSSTQQESPSKSSKDNNLIPMIIGALLVILVVGGGIFGYFMFTGEGEETPEDTDQEEEVETTEDTDQEEEGEFAEDTEKFIQGLRRFDNLMSYNVKSNGKLEFDAEDAEESINLSFDLKGRGDFEQDSFSASGNVKLKANRQEENWDYNLDGEIIYLENNLYGKLYETEETLGFPLLGELSLGKVTGRTVLIDDNLLHEFISNVKLKSLLTKETIQIINASDDQLGEVDTRRYIVKVDFESIESLLRSRLDEYSKDKNLTTEEQSDLQKDIQQIQKIGSRLSPFKVWMNDDFIVKMITSPFVSKNTFQSYLEEFFSESLDDVVTSNTWEIEFTYPHKIQKVEKPKDYISLDEFKVIFEDNYQPASFYLQQYNEKIKDDFEDIGSLIEDFYDESGGTLTPEGQDNFDNTEAWQEAQAEAPDCSQEIMQTDGYQIKMDSDSWVMWAALCGESTEKEEVAYYCLEQGGEADQFIGKPEGEGYTCQEIFEASDKDKDKEEVVNPFSDE